MPTIATPRSARSRPSSASPAATCLTYGQWLQMKVTTSAGPVSSSRLTVAPVAGSGSENDGAGVPRASMVDSMAMPARVTFGGSDREDRMADDDRRADIVTPHSDTTYQEGLHGRNKLYQGFLRVRLSY